MKEKFQEAFSVWRREAEIDGVNRLVPGGAEFTIAIIRASEVHTGRSAQLRDAYIHQTMRTSNRPLADPALHTPSIRLLACRLPSERALRIWRPSLRGSLRSDLRALA